MSLLAVVGAVLILVGLFAFLRGRHGESENSLEFGTLKFKTNTPSLVLVVLGVGCIAPRFVFGGETDEKNEAAKEGNSSQNGANKVQEAPKESEPAPKPAAEAAKQSYLAMVKAYNDRDEAGYYAAFAEPMQCFYSRPNAQIRGHRPKLDSELEVDAVDLTPLDVSGDRVEFCDSGRYSKGGKKVQHHKIIVMTKVGARWLVQVETTADQAKCYRSRFASRC